MSVKLTNRENEVVETVRDLDNKYKSVADMASDVAKALNLKRQKTAETYLYTLRKKGALGKDFQPLVEKKSSETESVVIGFIHEDAARAMKQAARELVELLDLFSGNNSSSEVLSNMLLEADTTVIKLRALLDVQKERLDKIRKSY